MYHLFKIGQTVEGFGLGVPPGPYRVTRLLPPSDGEPHYRTQSVADDHERALPESAMRVVQRLAPTAIHAKKRAIRGR
jgi:hypothetical protein